MKQPYYQDGHITIYNRDCRDMSELADSSVQCVVTSPPYWGLRKYSGEQELIWGGDSNCEHRWDTPTMAMLGFNTLFRPEGETSTPLGLPSDAGKYAETVKGGDNRQQRKQVGNICSLCGAWKGAYGLEPTPEMYIEHTIEILREIRRVLRKDGVVFLNLGDSYFSTSVGTGGYSKKQASNAVSYFDGGVRRGEQSGKRGKGLSDLKADDSSFESLDDEYGGCLKCHNLDTDDCPYPALGILSGLSSHSHKGRQPDHLGSLGLASQDDHNEGETSGLYSSLGSQDGVAHGVQESTNHASSGEFHRYPSDLICSYYQPSHHSASEASHSGTLYHIPKLKAKDLCLIPFRVAIAAQADGWYVRSVIIWSKPNPMPESVTDRPTESHEYILMLTKSARYYYDQDAVREAYDKPLNRWGGNDVRNTSHKWVEAYEQGGDNAGIGPVGKTSMLRAGAKTRPDEVGRNLRSVWAFPTQPYPEAHFAVFPEKLPELCIKAATPEVGCCSKCGAPWERIAEKIPQNVRSHKLVKGKVKDAVDGNNPDMAVGGGFSRTGVQFEWEVKTLGWQHACKCNADKVPALICDPFMGAGTSLWVAKKLNRNAIGYEISEEYCELALERNRQQAML